MSSNFEYVIYAAMLLLIVVLGAGLWSMLRGTSKEKSQKMMRWRLGVQAGLLAIVVIFVFYIKR